MKSLSCSGVGLSWSEDLAPSWLSPLMGEETVPYWVGTLAWGGAEMHVSLVLWGGCLCSLSHPLRLPAWAVSIDKALMPRGRLVIQSLHTVAIFYSHSSPEVRGSGCSAK